MSFLLDPPMLVACGAASTLLPDDRSRRFVRRAVLATFVGTSVGLYLNAPVTRPLWELCRAESGRDWMLNSGITRLEHDAPPLPVHVAAAALFALYPLWYRLGARLAPALDTRTKTYDRKQADCR